MAALRFSVSVPSGSGIFALLALPDALLCNDSPLGLSSATIPGLLCRMNDEGKPLCHDSSFFSIRRHPPPLTFLRGPTVERRSCRWLPSYRPHRPRALARGPQSGKEHSDRRVSSGRMAFGIAIRTDIAHVGTSATGDGPSGFAGLARSAAGSRLAATSPRLTGIRHSVAYIPDRLPCLGQARSRMIRSRTRPHGRSL